MDSAQQPHRIHAGDGRLTGRVIARATGKPLEGAQVGVLDGPQTRTNARGEWTLANVPTGTRSLQVRALGHYPERLAVDVIANAAPVEVGLQTLKAVLETVRVTAARQGTTNLVEFEGRRRTGVGRYITRADIDRRRPVLTSDLFRAIPGVYLDGGTDPDLKILMRGIFDDRCEPLIFIDGMLFNGVTAADLDVSLRPADLVGIEVYAPGTAPVQFQGSAQGSCGSIAFWRG
jgi:hypothetical protein